MKRGPYQIDVADSQSKAAMDHDRLHAVAADVLSHEHVAAADISVALIDGETMRELNNRHLGHDYDTDVLSFLLDCDESEDPSPDLPRGHGKTIDGEVLISTDIALKSAVEFDWCVDSEIVLYLVHGLLHLVGYDDLSHDEKLLMRERERFHLARWDLHPIYMECPEHEEDHVESTSPSEVLSPGVRG